MELQINRFARKADYTIGKLYIDGEYFCDTLEDTDRGLKDELSEAQIRIIKVAGATAIPAGRYEIEMNVVSPKFSKKAAYKFCGGRLPRLVGVKCFDGVLIHIGNTPEDTEGCILVGQNKAVGQVINSTNTFKYLWAILEKANKAGDGIYLDIQ